MKILVTGAAGFIGSHMAERLHSLGHEVIGLDNFSDYYDTSIKYNNAAALKSKGIRIIYQDLRAENLIDFLPFDLDYIFHFAGQPGIAATSKYGDYASNNLFATHNLLEFTKQNPSIKFFVNIATSSIYGSNATCAETQIPQPISNYGVTKLAAEQLVLSEARSGSLPGCSLRLYSVYGPRERPDKLFPRLIKSGLFNTEFPLYDGSLNHLRSFTYVDDIIDGVLSVIGKEHICDKQIFNIGTDLEYSTSEGIETVQKILGTQIKLNTVPARLGDQQQTKAKIDKARKLLGYSPKTTLFEGVKKQIDWFKATSGEVSPRLNH